MKSVKSQSTLSLQWDQLKLKQPWENFACSIGDRCQELSWHSAILPFSLALPWYFPLASQWCVMNLHAVCALKRTEGCTFFFLKCSKFKDKERWNGLCKQISNLCTSWMPAKKHVPSSSLHLCLFSAVRFHARYVKRTGASQFKRKKKIKPVSNNIGISSWEISSDESSGTGRESRKAKGGGPKQTVQCGLKQIKRSQDEEAGVKRDEWTRAKLITNLTSHLIEPTVP